MVGGKHGTAACAVAAALALSACAGSPAVSEPTESPPALAAPPIYDSGFFLADGTLAMEQYERLVSIGRVEEANDVAHLAFTPQAEWFGPWYSERSVGDYLDAYLDDADADGGIPLVVVDAAPELTCDFDATSEEALAYLVWVDALATGIDGREPWVILEPTALASLEWCDGQEARAALLGDAARILDGGGARVYLETGNSTWHEVGETVRRIELVGTEHLHGFATNTSNYISTADEVEFNDWVAAETGLRYIIDTSRNGRGSTGDWCNSRNKAIGEKPRLIEDGTPLDAYVWVKHPGESDGTCQGGPKVGTWWAELAYELVQNARLDGAI